MPIGLVLLVMGLSLLAIYLEALIGVIIVLAFLVCSVFVGLWNFLWSLSLAFYMGWIASIFIGYYYRMSNRLVRESWWRRMNTVGLSAGILLLVICIRVLFTGPREDLMWSVGYLMIIVTSLLLLGKNVGQSSEDAQPIWNQGIPWQQAAVWVARVGSFWKGFSWSRISIWRR